MSRSKSPLKTQTKRPPGKPGRFKATLGRLLVQLRVDPQRPGDDVVDEDVILLWMQDHRRIITGSDILGRLLRRIVGVGANKA